MSTERYIALIVDGELAGLTNKRHFDSWSAAFQKEFLEDTDGTVEFDAPQEPDETATVEELDAAFIELKRLAVEAINAVKSSSD